MVSVVMPAFNVARFIEESVESVRAQTWPVVELIVVDDGSTDGTGEKLARLGPEWRAPGRHLHLLGQPNRGAAAARNRGLAAARGEYIALFDSDDVCHPRLVEELVSALQGDEGLDLVFALYRYVDDAGRVAAVQPAPARSRLGTYDLLCDNVVHSPLFRASLIDAVGTLDETLRGHIDLDFFVRVTERRADSIGVVPEVLSDYRRRDGQITADWRRMRDNWLRVRQKLATRGVMVAAADERRMKARLRLYWATLAYQAGDYRAARRLIAAAWRHDARGVASDAHGRVRTAACIASLLPGAAHAGVRRWFNARRPDGAAP